MKVWMMTWIEIIGFSASIVGVLGYFCNLVGLLYFDWMCRRNLKRNPGKEVRRQNIKFMLGCLVFFFIPFSVGIMASIIYSLTKD